MQASITNHNLSVSLLSGLAPRLLLCVFYSASSEYLTLHVMIKTPESTRILITGGAGFVGTAIVSAIIQTHPEWRVTVADVRPEEEWKSPDHPTVDYVQLDVRKAEECYNAIELIEPHVVVHSAGTVPGISVRYGRNPVVQHNVTKLNVNGTANMLEAAKENRVPNFLFTSSCTVLSDDLDHDYPNMTEDLPIPSKSLMYGESKVAIDSAGASNATVLIIL